MSEWRVHHVLCSPCSELVEWCACNGIVVVTNIVLYRDDPKDMY